jgi:hypothetical protein
LLHALDGLVILEDPGHQSNFEIKTGKLGAYKNSRAPLPLKPALTSFLKTIIAHKSKFSKK